jgi:hypothetical protein
MRENDCGVSRTGSWLICEPCGSDSRSWLREIFVDVFAVENSYEGYCVGFDLQAKPVIANSDSKRRSLAL